MPGWSCLRLPAWSCVAGARMTLCPWLMSMQIPRSCGGSFGPLDQERDLGRTSSQLPYLALAALWARWRASAPADRTCSARKCECIRPREPSRQVSSVNACQPMAGRQHGRWGRLVPVTGLRLAAVARPGRRDRLASCGWTVASERTATAYPIPRLPRPSRKSAFWPYPASATSTGGNIPRSADSSMLSNPDAIFFPVSGVSCGIPVLRRRTGSSANSPGTNNRHYGGQVAVTACTHRDLTVGLLAQRPAVLVRGCHQHPAVLGALRQRGRILTASFARRHRDAGLKVQTVLLIPKEFDLQFSDAWSTACAFNAHSSGAWPEASKSQWVRTRNLPPAASSDESSSHRKGAAAGKAEGRPSESCGRFEIS